jgi:hypothetical protein
MLSIVLLDNTLLKEKIYFKIVYLKNIPMDT